MSNLSELINSKKPLLIDFFAEWCGPCKLMTPILQELKRDIGENATIIKVDVDKNQALARKYNVMGVPTLILFKEGQIKWRQSGVVDARNLSRIIGEVL